MGMEKMKGRKRGGQERKDGGREERREEGGRKRKQAVKVEIRWRVQDTENLSLV